jgi:lipoprotein signal peptidase
MNIGRKFSALVSGLITISVIGYLVFSFFPARASVTFGALGNPIDDFAYTHAFDIENDSNGTPYILKRNAFGSGSVMACMLLILT